MRTATTWPVDLGARQFADRLREEWATDPLPMAVIGWGYFGLAFAQHALHLYGPPLCPFRLLTGHPCPLCGMTHAFGALMAGDVSAAVHFNAFVVPVFVGWLAMTLAYTAQLTGRRFSQGAGQPK